jgi:hypothetical protein
MTQFEGQGLALACFVAVIVAGGLALLGHLRAAAALNGALAVLFLVLTAPSLIAWALRPDAYVQRYGRAAPNELPFTAGLVAVALLWDRPSAEITDRVGHSFTKVFEREQRPG